MARELSIEFILDWETGWRSFSEQHLKDPNSGLRNFRLHHSLKQWTIHYPTASSQPVIFSKYIFFSSAATKTKDGSGLSTYRLDHISTAEPLCCNTPKSHTQWCYSADTVWFFSPPGKPDNWRLPKDEILEEAGVFSARQVYISKQKVLPSIIYQ